MLDLLREAAHTVELARGRDKRVLVLRHRFRHAKKTRLSILEIAIHAFADRFRRLLFIVGRAFVSRLTLLLAAAG
jgi:hypothetical protein